MFLWQSFLSALGKIKLAFDAKYKILLLTLLTYLLGLKDITAVRF